MNKKTNTIFFLSKNLTPTMEMHAPLFPPELFPLIVFKLERLEVVVLNEAVVKVAVSVVVTAFAVLIAPMLVLLLLLVFKSLTVF
jgi:hypothetical protein